MAQKRWKLTIEYDGRPFAGWQRQDSGIPSVQLAIEDAIEKFCQQRLTIHVAGRTDAGVHARGQVAHLDLDYGDRPLTGFELAKAINAHVRPLPVAVLKAEEVPEEFHARFSATNKLYTYRLISRSASAAIDAGLAWQIWRKLDRDAMQAAARHLLDIESLTYDNCGGVELRFHVEGRSFLHHQVRNMVGSLVMVGEGKWSTDDMKRALEAKDRTKGGPTAPSDGLYLVRVDYDAAQAGK
jgi:tRNA pseudouridine38-40 synthase